MKKVDVKESAVGRETRIRKQWNEQKYFRAINSESRRRTIVCFL